MDKFEYRVETFTALCCISPNSTGLVNYNLERLNQLGNEGWEVCATDGNKYLLKRKI